MREELRATLESAWDRMWTRGDPTIIDELMTPDYVRHTLRSGDQGREELKQAVVSLRAAFPDIVTTIEDIFAEGDRVAVRWRSRATHGAEFMGVPATKKQIDVPGMTISRLEGDKVAEEWVSWDALDMLYRLGIIPIAQGLPQA